MTEKSVLLTFDHSIPGPGISNILNQAYSVVQLHLQSHSDGPIAEGKFDWLGLNGRALRVKSSNNRRMNWSAMSEAIKAIDDYMRHQSYGSAEFAILDGQLEVGQGTIG